MRGLALLPAIFCWLCAFAQGHVLTVEADSDLPRTWRGPFKLDSTQVRAHTAELRSAMIAHGWLAASCDSCTNGPDTTRCHFHLGETYRWARLSPDGVPPEIASAAGFRERLYRNRPITPSQVAKLFEDLLAECENHGYPFALVGLDSLRLDTGTGRSEGQALHAAVYLDRGRYVTFDSVVVRGTARISRKFLQAQIGIRPGDPYNEHLVRGLDNRTRELPFVTTRQPAYVLFDPRQTKLYLFLDAKRASQFNGILGLAQDPATGSLQFTGDLDLKLRNALHRGEAIDLTWRSLQDRTQDLKVGFNLPFAFNTPFGTDLGLKIFKRDTTFLEVNARAALEYLMDRGDKVRLFVNSKNSKRLGQLLAFTPGLGDVKLTSYGLGLRRERYDYRFNPRQGFSLDLEGSVGRKQSTTATFSDTVDATVHSIQFDLNGQFAWHIPVGKRGTVKLGGQGGAMINDQLYANELYRIGGLKTMRGMDEAGTYASSYTIGTVEYRYLFEQNGNLFLFFDQGWWEDQTRPDLLTDTPIGFGAGASFETKVGIFSLSYALGRQFNNPVELRNGKVHFGFASLF